MKCMYGTNSYSYLIFGDFLKTSFPNLKKLANTKTSLDRLTRPKVRSRLSKNGKNTYRVYNMVSEANSQLKIKKKGYLGRLPFAQKIRSECNRIFLVWRFARPESLPAGRKQQIKMVAASAASKGGKRGRIEPG